MKKPLQQVTHRWDLWISVFRYARFAPPALTIEYTYDWRSRKIREKVTEGSTPVHDQRTLYDHWNPVADFTILHSSFVIQNSLLWGPDLSGTLQGAGGVGGLLLVTCHSSLGTVGCFPSYDTNGNIIAWSDSTGKLIRRLDYDPFGNTVIKETLSGDESALDAILRHGFSTKPADSHSGLLYYGYRWLDPANGRWPSRDPIEEEGAINLYGFVQNNGIHLRDVLGLHAISLKLQNAPGYRCSGNFLWAAYAAFFTGLSPSTDYFATYTYTVGYSHTTCVGSQWEWTDLGERTITQKFSTRAGLTQITHARITPINQGMAAGDRGWAAPSISIDDAKTVIYVKFTAKLYKSNADIASLNLHRPMPTAGPYGSGFDGGNPGESTSWYDDAFGYGANHSSGFLNSPMPSSVVVVASETNRIEMHLCCCGAKSDYGNYKTRPAIGVHDRISHAFEVTDGLRMTPRK